MGEFGISKQRHVKEEHERQFNLFYLSMHLPKKGRLTSKNEDNLDFSKVVNMAIYDMSSQKTSYLFSEVSKTDIITHFMYEEGYDSNLRKINYNSNSARILNNKDIAERKPHDKLVVCQKNEDSGKQKIWSFTKRGENKALITEIDSQTEWRMDVFNQKLITFKRTLNAVEFSDYKL